MNASDPVDVAEIAKSKAIAHDATINEKSAYSKELAVDDMNIEPAPSEYVTGNRQEDGDEALKKEYPNEEDLRTLRRVAGALPWTTYTVAFVELCERFSYYGTTAVCKTDRRDNDVDNLEETF